MRVLDIGKMEMKWSSINGDTVVVVRVFMIKIFNRVVVKYYAEVSVLVEYSTQDIIPFHTGHPASKSLHRGRMNLNMVYFHSNPFIIILQGKLCFPVG